MRNGLEWMQGVSRRSQKRTGVVACLLACLVGWLDGWLVGWDRFPWVSYEATVPRNAHATRPGQDREPINTDFANSYTLSGIQYDIAAPLSCNILQGLGRGRGRGHRRQPIASSSPFSHVCMDYYAHVRLFNSILPFLQPTIHNPPRIYCF